MPSMTYPTTASEQTYIEVTGGVDTHKAVPATEPPYRQRLRAALARDLATLLAVPAGHIVGSDDLLRVRGGVPGQLITVEDPDDPHDGPRFIPETGNTGTGGGAYPLLDAYPGCSGYPRTRGDVPMVAITGLADLDNYQLSLIFNLALSGRACLCRSFGVSAGQDTATA